ncbi:MAG TPA: tetratricopeptide repeat protein [Polyangia bacterium]|nr:tetratricopeptide repeat protein [Polyangia bacterium]
MRMTVRGSARVALAVAAAVLARVPVALCEPDLWQRIADPRRDRADRLVQKAKELIADAPAPPAGRGTGARPPDNIGRAEELLREATALDPLDFATLFLLAEVQSMRGREAEAAATLERAEPLARLPSQRSACWFRLGLARSKLGRYREAVASYDQQIALGEPDATVYSNVAELLMTLGRLGEAEERYRDAIRIDERAADRRGREQSLAFSYYGLGVALDRDGRQVAAREAIGHAAALDPNLSLLRAAEQTGAEVFFIPDGDVFYYLGLAAERLGNRGDAGAAFQEYLARQPRSPWAARVRVHLAALRPDSAPAPGTGVTGSPPTPRLPSAPPPPPGWRVAALATVLSDGPIPAPVIDAALKLRPPGLETCLTGERAPRGNVPIRLAIEVELNAGGTVSRARVKLPKLSSGLVDGTVASCIESAIRTRLVVPGPARPRPTNVRIEVLLVTGDAAGL